jgi:hypothetical protein
MAERNRLTAESQQAALPYKLKSDPARREKASRRIEVGGRLKDTAKL